MATNKLTVAALRAVGVSESAITKILNAQGYGSNVVLSKQELELHSLRAQAKRYLGPAETPKDSRVAAKIMKQQEDEARGHKARQRDVIWKE